MDQNKLVDHDGHDVVMNTSGNRETIDRVTYFLLGFFVLSRLSAFITLELIGLPIYFPELLFFFFLPFFISRNGTFLANLLGHHFFTLAGIVLLFLLLAVWSHLFNANGSRYILATGRSYLYIALFFLLGKFMPKVNFKLVYLLSLGSVLSSLLWIMLNPLVESGGLIYYLNLSALFFVVFIPMVRGRYLLVSAGMPILIYLAIMSGSRRSLVVIILSAGIGLTINFLQGGTRTKVLGTLFLGIIVLLKDHIFAFIEKIASMDPLLYQRIVGKTLKTIEMGGAIGDRYRFHYIVNIPKYVAENPFPKGFLTRVPEIAGNGLFMDLPLYELCYTFGSILVIPLLAWVFVKAAKCLILNAARGNSCLESIVPGTIMIFMAFLFFDGGFLIWSYQTVFTGIFLGLLYNKEKVIEYV